MGLVRADMMKAAGVTASTVMDPDVRGGPVVFAWAILRGLLGVVLAPPARG